MEIWKLWKPLPSLRRTVGCWVDLVNYGPDPAAVVDFVRAHAAIVIRGNHDDAVGFDRDPRCSAPYRAMAKETMDFSLSALSAGQRDYLASLAARRQTELWTIRRFSMPRCAVTIPFTS